MSDPLDEFLAADFTTSSPRELRQAVLAATTRQLRRQRRFRRLRRAAALAACFLAGMATMAVWRTAPPAPPPAPGPVAALPDKKPDPPPQVIDKSATLADLEWRAFDSRTDRAALFFHVGHRYFEEHHDYDAALRCYRQALDAAPAEDLAIRPDDNWLVMALKEARQKERIDALAIP